MKNIIIVLLFSSLLQASPTENEFISCQKTSVKFLDRCLDISSNYADTSCWEQSKNTYSSCYKKVILSHDRKEQARIKAAKQKAVEKASLKQMNKKPSNASHSFKVSSIGRKNEEDIKKKTIEKAKERVLDECKSYSTSNYEISIPYCSRKYDKGAIWICVATVTCLID